MNISKLLTATSSGWIFHLTITDIVLWYIRYTDANILMKFNMRTIYIIHITLLINMYNYIKVSIRTTGFVDVDCVHLEIAVSFTQPIVINAIYLL